MSRAGVGRHVTDARLTVPLILCLVLSSGCLGGGNPDADAEEGPWNASVGADVDTPEPYTDAAVAFVVDGEQRGALGVEVSNTSDERQRGLMERGTVPDGAGMLFVYERPARRSFWMKDTLVPLDIIFVDGDGRVLNVEHASVETNVSDSQLTRYRSQGAAQYVVEAERGYANRTGVSPGDRLVIERR